MRWREAQGRKPNTSASHCFVRYRCGLESKAAYPVATQRWTQIANDFDIIAYAIPDDTEQAA